MYTQLKKNMLIIMLMCGMALSPRPVRPFWGDMGTFVIIPASCAHLAYVFVPHVKSVVDKSLAPIVMAGYAATAAYASQQLYLYTGSVTKMALFPLAAIGVGLKFYNDFIKSSDKKEKKSPMCAHVKFAECTHDKDKK